MEKKFIQLKNGETYAYLEKGSGKPLILIHGNLSSSVYYLPLIERLPDDIRVIALDLRGFGDSSYLSKFDSLANLATDVQLFMSELKIEKASIAGWSLGGGVAMEIASRYPRSVDKLILINSTTHKGYPIFKKDKNNAPILTEGYKSKDELATDPLQVKPILEAIATENAFFMSYIYDLTIYTHNKPTPEANQLYIKETLKQRCLVDADYALACLNMSDVPNLYTKGDGSIKHIKADTLMFWGTLDKTVPEYMVLDNLAALPKAKYIKFEQCGHSPLVDKPNELAEEILKFI
ncbi:alpha/beta hydrolase [Acholeplasma vituli]|uniref:Alpha/beta hydrolase n=1 Tax=Paracholeplasma vituli TaxID=69473 RepID=A0ABT2PZI8_9MOLU|nr:alpha/beta hydrolase [Paracholeplasma vituli]MCU0105068.1 alpha/beta hydrolase [Paracholeplasma vituli]